jgi:hypothetical protein
MFQIQNNVLKTFKTGKNKVPGSLIQLFSPYLGIICSECRFLQLCTKSKNGTGSQWIVTVTCSVPDPLEVRIRLRIRGSVPLTDPDLALSSVTFKKPTTQ